MNVTINVTHSHRRKSRHGVCAEGKKKKPKENVK